MFSQKYEPGTRKRRSVDQPAYNITKTFSLKRKLSVFSPDDVVFRTHYNEYSPVNSPVDSEEFVNVGLFSKLKAENSIFNLVGYYISISNIQISLQFFKAMQQNNKCRYNLF